jgi:hypothetical protein
LECFSFSFRKPKCFSFSFRELECFSVFFYVSLFFGEQFIFLL